MGRRRIFIAKITQEKRRRNTFGKRKKGLLKKAMELSILCDCEVAVVVIAKSETYAYASNGLPLETVQRALNNQPDVLNNSMYDNLYNGEDDSLSGDEDLYSSSTDLAPSVPPIIPTGGGILVEKVPRTKRKRESMPQEEIPERPAPLHPAINESTEVHTYQRFSPTGIVFFYIIFLKELKVSICVKFYLNLKFFISFDDIYLFKLFIMLTYIPF